MPKSFSSEARSFLIAALSPKPLIIRLAPSCASARAVASPMPEVEPVTRAVLPLSIAVLVLYGTPAGAGRDFMGTGRWTVPLNLLRCNIYLNHTVQRFAIFTRMG